MRAILCMENIAEGLTDTFTFVITGTRSLTRNIAAVAFGDRHMTRVGIAIDFAGRKECQPRIMALRQFQHVPGTGNRDLQRLQRESAIVIRTGNARRMNDVVEISFPVERLDHIVLDKFHIGI